MSRQHHITKKKVPGARAGTLRARCSCGGFSHDALIGSPAQRRRLERLIGEHLVSAAAGNVMAALDATAATIEGPAWVS